jgi:hypothetical protein
MPGRRAASCSAPKPRRSSRPVPEPLREDVRPRTRSRSVSAPTVAEVEGACACRGPCPSRSVRPGSDGEAMCSTSAPCSASVRAQAGPARTRVRSSTRMPLSGRSPSRNGSLGASPIFSTSTTGFIARSWPWGWTSHSSFVRQTALHSPFAASASSSSQAPRRFVAASMSSLVAVPSRPSSARMPGAWVKLPWRWMKRPSPQR